MRYLAAILATITLIMFPTNANAMTDLGSKPGLVVHSAVQNPTPDRNPRVSRSMRGIYPSAYIGRYFDSRYEAKRRCIVRRESMGMYFVVNRSSGASGAYQFLPSTARVVARMMGTPGLGSRANTWSRYWQDRAFWTLFNHGRGAGHWAGGRWRC